MSWAAAAPTYATPIPPYAAQERTVRYAGFWRRYWGLVVDSVLLSLANVIVGFAIGMFSRVLLSATATCVYGYGSCRTSTGLAWTMFGIQSVVSVAIWYRIIPRRLAAGATPGMRQLGLRVEGARDGLLIGTGAAVGRSLLPGLLQFGGMAVVASVLVFSFDPDEPVQDFAWWFGLGVGLVVACYGPALWQLVDRRHQTLYDKIVGSVVVEERAPNWWAVASFACAMTGLLAPLAIVFGHIGLHQMADPHNHQAGHGLAASGTALGYVFTVAGTVFLAVIYSTGLS